LVDCLAILMVVRLFPGMGGVDSRSLRDNTYVRMHHLSISFVDLLLFPVDVFWGDVRRECMQRLSTALHGTLGSYIRESLQEGSADAVVCLRFPRA
jgi:hypothetical protein